MLLTDDLEQTDIIFFIYKCRLFVSTNLPLFIAETAMSNVVDYVKEVVMTSTIANKIPVFLQKDLTELYRKKMIAHGASKEFSEGAHCTRIRHKILEKVPGLCELESGRQMTLTLNDKVGQTLFAAYQSDEEEELMFKAATVIRRSLLAKDEVFDGGVSSQRQEKSVPKILVNLISMILEGVAPGHEIPERLKKISTNLAQLIRFNSVKRTRNQNITDFRHSRNNEPPFPVKNGLFVYAKTRKKALVDRLAQEGLSIGYERVLDIRRSIASQECRQYNEDGIVCPTRLANGKFITAAVDNLDHNLTSVTADSSFHGTTISIFQHEICQTNVSEVKFDPSVTDRKQRPKLPSSYTDIKPTRDEKPEPPIYHCDVTAESTPPKPVCEDAEFWLESLASLKVDEREKKSFSAFYSSKWASSTQVGVTGNHLLPLIQESVDSPATVRHAMQQIVMITEKINPGQIPVITGD